MTEPTIAVADVAVDDNEVADIAVANIAVADLARFCHRSGDIDQRFKAAPTGAQGVAGHQRVYARRPASYRSEYAVAYQHSEPGLQLTLRGRADGYDAEEGLVEEIKTCRGAPDALPEAVAQLHFAQGRLYAAIIAAQGETDALTVRVTWFNIDSGEEFSRSEHYTRAELADFLADTLARFAHWLHTLMQARRERDASIVALAFPYGGFRSGQREIAELAYKCVHQGGQLLLEAPTGIGKTAAVLFPALKALATGRHDKVLFLTAKTVGRRAAQAALADFAAAGYRGTALSLTAKEKICFSPGRACHGDDCPFARNYYDKLPAAMYAAIAQRVLTREDVESIARRFEVCPYELGLDLLPWVDVAIADLHYVYSLTATLGNPADADGERWTVLLDEAHNLPGRARGMYSAALDKAAVLQAKAQATGDVEKSLARVNRQFLALQKMPWQEQQFHACESPPPDLLQALQGFTGAVGERLAEDSTYLQRQRELMDFYFEVLQFQRVAELWGEDYRFELSLGEGRQSLSVTLNCLDPARLLSARHARAHAVIAFSATLSPLPWSRAALGLDVQTVCSRATSPFAPAQLQVALATGIDTRYQQREQSLPALVHVLRRWLEETPGNCIVYFPSYHYLQDAVALLQAAEPLQPSRSLWIQARQQDDREREQLLQLLEEREDVAAFCILGGVFGEGIDLPGKLLSSVVVVGVGMPQVNRDTRQLQDWYQHRYAAGFEYAFLYPGMQKVDQALGRVVRRLEDTGRALLIDPRYRQRQYRDLLPPWWEYRNYPA
ncbi:MAG: ATP-dependent DNA helicase [Haliea sp.]|nr:ATP-dependent DNA helicase [Haliea sp.]